MDDFLTIYKQDYQKKPYKKIEPCKDQQQFSDPLCEGYKNYLSLTEDCVAPIEEVNHYSDKFKEKHKKIAEIYFKEPLDKNGIVEHNKSKMKTVYEVDYGNPDEDARERNNKFELPEDWIIPHTTQKIDYRDPVLLNKNVLINAHGPTFKPESTLGKGQYLVKIAPDLTTYQDEYSKLGEIIITKQLHGKIVYPQCTCAKHNLMSTK